MAPNNNVPTIQLTEIPIPTHAVSEIGDTQMVDSIDVEVSTWDCR